MYNPFPLYDIKYLQPFLAKGVKCFVKQTYDRGRNMLEENPKPAFLISHYNEIGLALEHLDALKHDTNARILRIDNAADLSELRRMGMPGASERVYMYFKQADAERRLRKTLDKRLHAYIDHKLNWKIPGYQTVQMKLDFIFGEIYVELRHGSKYHKIKLEEVESNAGYLI